MPLCRNAPTVRYTGKEPSPKGLGWSARAEEIGTRKRGKDGRMWAVTARGGARKSRYWKVDAPKSSSAATPKRPAAAAPKRSAAAVPKRSAAAAPKRSAATVPKRPTAASSLYPVAIPKPRWNTWLAAMKPRARQRLSKLIRVVIPQLTAAGIMAYIVPLPYDAARGVYFIDQAWDWIRDQGWTWGTPMILAVLRYRDGRIVPEPTMYIQHDLGRSKTAATKIMSDAFGVAFEWSGSTAKAMKLKLT